jgi:hypothetical protein
MVRRCDRDVILRALDSAGYRTEVSFPHWLAKAFGDDGFVDVSFSSMGYHDARLEPEGRLPPEEVAHWTAAISGAARPRTGNLLI